MTPTPCRVAGCLIPIRPTYFCAHACTYLHSWLCAYETDYISETVEDVAKVTINGQYKIGHGLSIAAKI